MRDGNSLVEFLPPDTTDLIQANDRGLGKMWKDRMNVLMEEHMEKNWDMWFDGTASASKRRILMTEFAGQAWEEVCKDQKAITRSFEACGLTLTKSIFKDILGSTL